MVISISDPNCTPKQVLPTHSMATTGWWSWLVIHTSILIHKICLKDEYYWYYSHSCWSSKKTTKSSHSMINRAQGQSNSLWMKSSISTYFDHDFPIVLSPRSTPGDPGAWHVRQQGLDAHVAARGVATKNHPAACTFYTRLDMQKSVGNPVAFPNFSRWWK